jgi:hypothetical protein
MSGDVRPEHDHLTIAAASAETSIALPLEHPLMPR